VVADDDEHSAVWRSCKKLAKNLGFVAHGLYVGICSIPLGLHAEAVALHVDIAEVRDSKLEPESALYVKD
jgi:hypothetical protein